MSAVIRLVLVLPDHGLHPDLGMAGQGLSLIDECEALPLRSYVYDRPEDEANGGASR